MFIGLVCLNGGLFLVGPAVSLLLSSCRCCGKTSSRRKSNSLTVGVPAPALAPSEQGENGQGCKTCVSFLGAGEVVSCRAHSSIRV